MIARELQVAAATSARELQVVAATASAREMQVAVSTTVELQVVRQRSCSETAGGGDSAGGATIKTNTVELQVEQQERRIEVAAHVAAAVD